MRINPINNIYNRQNSQTPSFSGIRQTRFINVGNEENVREYFGGDDVSTLASQRLLIGQQKLIRLMGTYEPSVTLKGSVYVCDQGEWAGDEAKETNAAVVVDKGKEALTLEVIDSEEKHSVSEIRFMIKCLRNDIIYQREQIGHIETELSKGGITKERKEKLEGERQKRSTRLVELEEMKRLADKNLEDTLAFLKANHFDFKKAKRRRELRARGYCV